MKVSTHVFLMVSVMALLITSCQVIPTEPTPDFPATIEQMEIQNQIATMQMDSTQQAATIESLITQATPTIPPLATDSEITPEIVEVPEYAGEFIVIEAEGLIFKLPVEVAEGATVSTVLPDDPAEGWLDFALPERRMVNFSGYSIQNHFHTPVIYVYPLQKLIEAGQYRETMATNLQELLDNDNIDLQLDADLPFLPPFNAGQVFHVLEERLTSEHNSGIRYLTLYSQAIVGVDNYNIFYTYQGISADQQYYIAAILPINSTLLSYEELTLDEMDTISQDFTNYIITMTELIRTDNGESLIPTLAALDSMMMSLLSQD
ncbi:MAG: hypothetical protein RBS09_00015 [Anaerolineaceae bacterium]|jgi:hypothetical protein|nr:hypothetical protein [Anaerolineaceae bacterium]